MSHRLVFNTYIQNVIVASMFERAITATTIASLCLLLILMNLISPADAGPFGILAIFICAYLALMGILALAIHFSSKLFSILANAFISKRPVSPLSLKRSCYFSMVLALAPIMLAGLQSVGAGSVYSMMLVFIFVALGCLYMAKMK